MKIYTHCPLCKAKLPKKDSERGLTRCVTCIRSAVRKVMKEDNQKESIDKDKKIG